MSYTKAVDTKFESWAELLACVAGLRDSETLNYKAPLDPYETQVEVVKQFKNGKLRVRARDAVFTADAGHLSRFSLRTYVSLKDDWRVIGRGKAGWHAERPGCSSSGGTLEPISGTYGDGRPWSRAGYLAEAAEGCRVYDADGAEYGAFAAFVCGGPMLSTSLGDEECDAFSKADAGTARGMLGPGGLSGGFDVLVERAIAEVAAERKYSSLDRVGWGIYRRLLAAACPETRFGVVRAGAVVWENDAPANA